MPQGVKYCVGVFEKDSIISYYERFQDGIFLKDEKGIKDSLWTYEIFDGVQAMDPIGPLAAPSRMTPRRSQLGAHRSGWLPLLNAHRLYLKGRSPTSQLIPCSCMKPFAAPVY